MRFILAFIALLGFIAAALALREHYRTDTSPCAINAHWDCGIVNHSRHSVLFGIPVAALGIVGYAAIALFAFLRRRWLTLLFSLIGLGFALYLSNIEAHVLQVWCLYCVISQVLIALIFLLSLITVFVRPKTSR
jgi:vitamin-K-epoxide reductase (warfarin-sensitive)